jgi:hypothetical protein
MIAALRDPDPYSKPDTRTDRKYHVAIVTSPRVAVPACSLPLVLLRSSTVAAATFDKDRQCKRDRCAMAFAEAGAR